MAIKLTIIITLLFSNFLIGQSYYFSTSDCDLVLANLKTCTSTKLCNTFPMQLYDIAITPNNSLYSTDGIRIFRLDPDNCSHTVVTDSLAGAHMYGEMNALVAVDDSILIAATVNHQLYKASLNSGTFTLMGYLYEVINGSIISYTPDGDLAFYKGHLYMTTMGLSGPGLLQIGVDDNYTTITYLNMRGNMQIPGNFAFGMATITDGTCKNDNLKSVVFGAHDAYMVDPFDASTKTLCTRITNSIIYGAASIIEIDSKDRYTEIELPNVFTPNGDNANDYFIPSKAENVIANEISIYDRWGKIVYHSNEKLFIWDGLNQQNEESSEGNYFYVCLTKNACDETIKHQGFITLMR